MKISEAIRFHAALSAALIVGVSGAVTVGPEWSVAYSDSEPECVTRALRVAAVEIRSDIEESTGMRLKLVPASSAKSPAIYIGAEPARKAGFDLSGLKGYDNVIAERGGSVYLFGNDRPGVDPQKWIDRLSPELKNKKYARRIPWYRCLLPSVKAATRFLENAVGVRFLMPGEVGKEVPKRESVSVADGYFTTETPPQIYGSGKSTDERLMIDRIANGVWGRGAFWTFGGHTYPHACPAQKYFKTHPEYFGLKNGKRILGQTPGTTPLCISNPEVENLIVETLKSKFDLGAEVCELGQNDGSLVCECEKCRALFGTGDDWSEKFWLFHKRIAERILAERPGKIVQILNYGKTKHPPKTFNVFPPNVMIEKCSYSEEAFREWEGYVVPHGFTVYTYLVGCYVMPGFVARSSFAHLAQLAKRFRDNNVLGMLRDGTAREGTAGDLFGTEGPAYYVYNRLLIDGTLNVSELLEDYCRSAFGPAAQDMRKFYDVQDARLRMFSKLSDGFPVDGFPASAAGLEGYTRALPKNPLDLHGYTFSPDTTAAMEKSLSKAERAKGLSEKNRKRLQLVRLEFDYAKMLGEIATLYAAYKLRPSKESLAPLVEVLRRRNDYMDRIFDGGKNPKCIDGWPEVVPFGTGCTRKLMNVNGRLFAPIGAPLTWPLEKLGDSLPGTGVKTADVVRTASRPTFGDFADSTGWNELSGMSMEEVPVKSKFKVLCDDANLYVLFEGDLADDVKVASFPHDGEVWTDDAVDLMLAPNDTREVFYHFIYGPDPSSRYDDATGLVKDPLDPSFGKAVALWNAKGWKTSSVRGGGKWHSISAFPYSDFGVKAPNPGDIWYINVGRVFKTGDNRREVINMLWSPNMESRSYIAPEAMGKIIFK